MCLFKTTSAPLLPDIDLCAFPGLANAVQDIMTYASPVFQEHRGNNLSSQLPQEDSE